MSETSEDKTKRKYLAVFQGFRWNFQYSVFYEYPEESHALRDHMVKFKQALRRRYSDQPFLVRIQSLKKGNGPLQAYLTIFTTKKLRGLPEMANQIFPALMRVLYRQLSEGKHEKIARSIALGKPHDLSKFFEKTGVNRWSILNKEKLEPLKALED